jgi:hypothetical protein
MDNANLVSVRDNNNMTKFVIIPPCFPGDYWALEYKYGVYSTRLGRYDTKEQAMQAMREHRQLFSRLAIW